MAGMAGVTRGRIRAISRRSLLGRPITQTHTHRQAGCVGGDEGVGLGVLEGSSGLETLSRDTVSSINGRAR